MAVTWPDGSVTGSTLATASAPVPAVQEEETGPDAPAEVTGPDAPADTKIEKEKEAADDAR